MISGYQELLDGVDFCRHSETRTGEVPARNAVGICPQALLESAQGYQDDGQHGPALAVVRLLGYQPEATRPPGFIELRAKVHASLGKP